MATEGRWLRIGRPRAGEGTVERRRHPLPQRPGRDEGLGLRGGRCRDARARPRTLGRAGSAVARAPPGLPSPPPPHCCARADTGCGGGGPRHARARPSRSSRWRALTQLSSRGRAFDGSTRRRNPARGRRRKSARAVSARAPHPRAVPVSASPSLGWRVCREQVAGMSAPRRGGGGGPTGMRGRRGPGADAGD